MAMEGNPLHSRRLRPHALLSLLLFLLTLSPSRAATQATKRKSPPAKAKPPPAKAKPPPGKAKHPPPKAKPPAAKAKPPPAGQAKPHPVARRNPPPHSLAPPPPPAAPYCLKAGTKAMMIDKTLFATYFNGSAPRVLTARSAPDCLAIVKQNKCSGEFPANFFLFANDGFFTNGTYMGNCAFGAACSAMQPGSTSAVAGALTGAPKGCSAPAPKKRACPRRISKVRFNPDRLFLSFGNSTVDVAAGARACLLRAQAAVCQGYRTRWFLYADDGFSDPYIGFMGNCIYGSDCTQLSAGTSTATAGPIRAPKCPK